jgi:hypothetical protein
LISHIKGKAQAGGTHEQGAREAVIGGWNKLNNGELRDLYLSSIIQKIRWDGHVACMERKETNTGFW